jgi:two-component system chemotaxis response regulator CheB
MPRNALLRDHVDYCVPLAKLAALLVTLAEQPAGPPLPLPSATLAEARIAEQEFANMSKDVATPGSPSSLSCPQCGGVLNEIHDEGVPRYRCQIGHAFSAAALAAAQNDELERALAVAVRTHRDRLKLFRQMEASALRQQHPHSATRWGQAAAEAEHLATVLENAMRTLRKPLQSLE